MSAQGRAHSQLKTRRLDKPRSSFVHLDLVISQQKVKAEV